MSVLKNDFVGFTYNGKHSSELGIVRTSDGSRFNINLLPTIQDKTVQVPGRDGSYFFGSYYTQNQVVIPFAFDSLTEEQFRFLRKHFGDKKIHSLIFDEMPYKQYQAKVTGSATIKHICFDEEVWDDIEQIYKKIRIYKGEGTIQFTMYDPFARSVHKFLKEYDDSNLEEWRKSSGMKFNGLCNDNDLSSLPLDSYDPISRSFYIYNPGDKESDFILKLSFKDGYVSAGSIYMNTGNDALKFNKIFIKNNDAGIQINSKLNLIEGIDSTGNKTGTLYNEYIHSGSFFKIPQIGPDDENGQLFVDLTDGSADQFNPQIIYDYYYF